MQVTDAIYFRNQMVLKDADSDDVNWTYSRYDIIGDKTWNSTTRG
jgi:hypothetical protein